MIEPFYGTQNIGITFVQCWTTSKTLGRRCTNVIQLFCVCWDCLNCLCNQRDQRGLGVVETQPVRSSQIHPPLWHSGFKETNVSSPLTRKESISIVGRLFDRAIACSCCICYQDDISSFIIEDYLYFPHWIFFQPLLCLFRLSFNPTLTF